MKNNSQTYEVIISSYFKKQLKKLVKKNPYLKKEFKYAVFSFEKRFHIPIGKNAYKIRLKGFNKGKSGGGYRLYACVLEVENILIPICIYPKGNQKNISERELKKHILKIQKELGFSW